LPITLTINGIDGFKSGKWTLHPNARVIDDETLDSITGATNVSSLIYDPLPPGTYTLSCAENTGTYYARDISAGDNAINNLAVVVPGGTSSSFTLTSAKRVAVRHYGGMLIKPQLNMGSTLAPYSKKTGERMWMPGKPKVKLAGGKNLFDGLLELGDIAWLGHNLADTTRVRSVNFINVKPNTTYQMTHSGTGDGQINSYDISGLPVAWSNVNGYRLVKGQTIFTTPNNCYKIKIVSSGNTNINSQIQIEQGSTPTPYEPYTEVLPPAKKGLVMDGVNNYLQFPSMTMDSVEIDCLIKPKQSNSTLIDARTGLSLGYVSVNSSGSIIGGSSFTIEGYKLYERTKIKASKITSFTDDINIFSAFNGSEKTEGILYGVKCYLNGQVVAEYDFTNQNNIVGDKVLQSAKNLIPVFDDPSWSIHSNARVLGKDTLQLNAPSTALSTSEIKIPVKPNTNYLLVCNHNGYMLVRNGTGSLLIVGGTSSKSVSFSSGIYSEILIRFFNPSVSGMFDFIRPQLYELDGKEGTLFGNPVSELKAPKRVLYAKR
jgi:hypothetical protein